MSLVGFSQNVERQFKNGILGYLLPGDELASYFEANNLRENVGKGQDRITYMKVQKPEGGILSPTIHNANTVVPAWEEVTTGLDYLVARIILSKQSVDKFSTGKWLRGDLIRDTLDLVMPQMKNQFDQLLAWGYEYQDTPDALDIYADSHITGIFNGGTAYGGGLGGDNDMQQADDYLDTVDGMIQALRAAYHKQEQYLLLSDENTWRYAGNENQFYSTVGITERQRILERKDIKKWMHSPNFIDDSGVKYRMAMIAPLSPKIVGGKGPQSNVSIYDSYDYDVLFDFNGGTSNLNYVFYIIKGFKLVEHRSTAIQRTGTLTLT